jgi:drug/metabolite transporter (DMT)-like permease
LADTHHPYPDFRTRLTGIALVFAAAVGFSTKAILVKLAYRHAVDAVTLLALRMAFSLPFFLIMGLWSGIRSADAALERRDWWVVLGLGLLGYYLASFLDFLGLQYISAGLERLVLFLYPTLVILLSALFFRRRIRPVEIAALILSYAGIVLVVSDPVAGGANRDLALGVALVFGSTLAYALYLVGSGQAIVRFGPARFTAWAMGFACLACMAQFALSHPPAALVLPWEVYGLSLAMAVFSTVLPALWMAQGIRRIGASRASLVGGIGPVATLFLAYRFLGETVSAVQIAGSLLVVLGIVLVGVKK